VLTSVEVKSGDEKTCRDEDNDKDQCEDISEEDQKSHSSESDADSEDKPEDFDLQDLVTCHKKGESIDKIPKPRGTGGRNYNIRDRMGLSDNATWYNDVLVWSRIQMEISRRVLIAYRLQFTYGVGST
jgi:hypothetical protein